MLGLLGCLFSCSLGARRLPISLHLPALTETRPEPLATRLDEPVNPFGREEINLLVVGSDAGDAAGRTDTILLVAIDTTRGAVGVLSIPRDTRVALGRHGVHKINAAWRLGGAKLLAQAVADLTQAPVHHYLRVELSGFEQIIDRLGGIDLTIAEPMRYEDHAQGLIIDLPAGHQHLDGRRALQYVRFRSDAEGDLGRIKRQQRFLRAVAAKLTAPRNLRALPSRFGELARLVDSSLTPAQLSALARLALGARDGGFPARTLPGSPRTVRGVSYYEPAPEAARAVTALRAELARPAPRPLVTVYNASNRLGLDRVVVRRLQAAGFMASLGSRTPLPETPTSRVYGVDDDGAAARVADVLAAALVAGPPPAGAPSRHAPATNAARVVVIVGDDCPTR